MLKVANSVISASRITGVLPVVNGGTGVTTSTGTGNTVLSAAPTLSGDVTLSTGNLIVANGQGIDFSATPGTGTSELLADYEEGTWTPVVTAISGSYTTVDPTFGRYTKIGNLVTVRYYFVVSNKGTGLVGASVAGLPFTSAFAAVGIGANPTNVNAQTASLGGAATSFVVFNYNGLDPVVAGQANQGIMSYFV